MSMISKIRKSSLFPVYLKLFNGEYISDAQRTALLSVSIECYRSADEISRKLGYRIALAYAIKYKDFEPLLQFSINDGHAPLIASIIKKISESKRKKIGELSLELLESSTEPFRDGDIILTNDQWELKSFFYETENKNATISAPTSFGKSDLIIDYCAKRKNNKICIVVPTKALVAQTRMRILDAGRSAKLLGDEWEPKVVTHPDSSRAALHDAICIYTQERFFRHFIKFGEDVFSDILVDEAHNIFGNGSREVLLAYILTLHQSRADSKKIETRTKYFTPFLVNPNSIELKYKPQPINGVKVNQGIKSEAFIIADLKGKLGIRFYDQFFDQFSHLAKTEHTSVEEYIAENSSNKNIVYQNRPINIERSVRELIRVLPPLLDTPEIAKSINAIKEYIHPDYLLAQALQCGIVYHHGSVPDTVKLYIEHIFSKLSEIRFIICNSTLLEGVNIPATRLFMPTLGIGPGNLSASQFNNLVGRICRYREIFSGDELNESLLMPQIHIIKNTKYMHASANPDDFLKHRTKVDKKKSDKNQNPLIDLDQEKINSDEIKKAETFLDIIDPTLRDTDDIQTTTTTTGYLSFTHNISEVDILRFERNLESDISKLKKLKNIEDFLQAVAEIFIERTADTRDTYELRRLLREGVRNYYSMLIRWRIEHLPLPIVISNLVSYWEENGGLVFAGRWGDYQAEGDHYERWIDWKEKSDSEKVNFAIVKVQDEYDFIENALSKYVELFHDLEVISEDLYLDLKYGTRDPYQIEMIKSGFNPILAQKLLNEYNDYITIPDGENHQLIFSEDILDEMDRRSENPISIFEVKLMAGL